MRALLLVVLAGCAAGQHVPDGKEGEPEVVAIMQAMLDAIATGDKTIWERHLGDDVVYVDEDRVLDKTAAAAVPVREELGPYAGAHALSPGYEVTVTVEGGKLFAQRKGRDRQELLPLGVGVYFVAGSEGQRIFVRNASGAVDGFLDRRSGADLLWKRVP